MSKQRRWIKKRNRALHKADRRHNQQCANYVQVHHEMTQIVGRLMTFTESGLVQWRLTEKILRRLLEFTVKA